jgi:hypothetical protein
MPREMSLRFYVDGMRSPFEKLKGFWEESV